MSISDVMSARDARSERRRPRPALGWSELSRPEKIRVHAYRLLAAGVVAFLAVVALAAGLGV